MPFENNLTTCQKKKKRKHRTWDEMYFTVNKSKLSLGKPLIIYKTKSKTQVHTKQLSGFITITQETDKENQKVDLALPMDPKVTSQY